MGCSNYEQISAVAHDHAARPRNHGLLDRFNGRSRITGPCGDTMEFRLSVQNDVIARISFITDGCGSSLACGSMATTLAEGKKLESAAAIGQQDILDALGGLPPDLSHCALLAANTLRTACEDYVNRSNSHPKSCGHVNETKSNQIGDRQKLDSRLSTIRHSIVVLSGKGGVGKSTVAVNLAIALMNCGKSVGLLDVDVHGPSIPIMLGLENESISDYEGNIVPVELGNLKVMSLGFLLRDPEQAVIWRGPMKMGVIRQFLEDVVWGDLDYLIIDCPPGTGDEPLSVCQLLPSLDGALIVTTPQKVAASDVRKSVTFCRELEVPILGIVENMSGFACPECGKTTQVFCSGAGRQIAEDMHVPFLGAIPLDPEIAAGSDNGRPCVNFCNDSRISTIMKEIFEPVIALDPADKDAESEFFNHEEEVTMRIVIPLADGKLTAHFGHCASFAFIDVDPTTQKILKREDVDAPPHEPGLLPTWLAERGAELIIAGGIGQRAQSLLAERRINVITGAPVMFPEELVSAYLSGNLTTGENACDH